MLTRCERHSSDSWVIPCAIVEDLVSVDEKPDAIVKLLSKRPCNVRSSRDNQLAAVSPRSVVTKFARIRRIAFWRSQLDCVVRYRIRGIESTSKAAFDEAGSRNIVEGQNTAIANDGARS